MDYPFRETCEWNEKSHRKPVSYVGSNVTASVRDVLANVLAYHPVFPGLHARSAVPKRQPALLGPCAAFSSSLF